MMRETRTPQEGCGLSREGIWGRNVPGAARAFARNIAFVVALAISGTAHAQDPTAAQDPTRQPVTTAPSAFKDTGGMIGKVKTKLDSSQPMKLQGDQLIYDTNGNRVVARGNVEIFYNDYILTADEVVYDQSAGTLTAVGNVMLKEPQGNVIRADRYTLTDDFRDGFVQSLSVVTRDDTRISAEGATRREGNVTEFQNGRFTPCKSDGNTPPLWCISAARVIHDKEAATISYQDAQFELFGQPIIYLPYFQHPDPSVKRKSGFLAPDIGQSTSLGFITGIPYYYALAPNMDFTFNPTYMSKQGVLWKGEWRHRLENGQYTVKMAGIDQNGDDLPGDISDDKRADLDGWRGSIETKGLFSLSSWWKFGWDVTLESDDEFRRFYKLDSILVTDRVNQVFLVGQSDRNFFAARAYHFGGLLLDDTPDAESMTHPIIDYNYVFDDPVLGGELKIDTNVLSFSRRDVGSSTTGFADQNINRIVTEVKWRRRFTDAVGITYTPFANLRGDIYQFDNFTDPTTVVCPTPTTCSGDLVDDDTTFRGVAAGGATVTYPWVANTAYASHVIEPIAQIITRQESVTQRQLPDEDARSLIFDDTNLFEVSKFSGYDRTEMGTRVNAGIQYTFQANDGGYARFLAGQSYHLSGDNVYADPGRTDDGNFIYSPTSGLETDRSDYVLGAYIAPTDSFRIISQSRFNESDLTLRREDLSAQFIYGPLVSHVTYAYAANDPELDNGESQQDIVAFAGLQLTDRWSVGAGVRYDIDDDRLLYDSMQVRYADECFVLTASYSEYYYDSDTIDDDRTLMLRFELKHLGGYAYKTDSLDFAFGGEQRTD